MFYFQKGEYVRGMWGCTPFSGYIKEILNFDDHKALRVIDKNIAKVNLACVVQFNQSFTDLIRGQCKDCSQFFLKATGTTALGIFIIDFDQENFRNDDWFFIEYLSFPMGNECKFGQINILRKDPNFKITMESVLVN